LTLKLYDIIGYMITMILMQEIYQITYFFH